LSSHLDVDDRPVIVGIAGGSGSGKTTLAQAVYEQVGVEHVTFICHDSYYRDLSHLSIEERAIWNFDHPDALDTELLVQHLQALKRGEDVQIPTYDFTTHTRRVEVEERESRHVILVEGILIFADEALRDMFDIKIFVETEGDIRFIRRMQRDIRDRGRDLDSVIEQYLTTVRPMHKKFVEPNKHFADVVIPLGLNNVALDLFVSRLRFAIGI
jgi:uridine kinase